MTQNRVPFSASMVTSNWMERSMQEADTVLVAAGMKPAVQRYSGWYDLVPEVIPIGDSRKAGKILEAMRTGYCAGLTV